EETALKVDLLSDDVVVVDAGAQCGVDSCLVSHHSKRSHFFWRKVDVKRASTLHSRECTGEVENVHERKSFRVGVVRHSNGRELSRTFEGIHVEFSFVSPIRAATSSYLSKCSLLLILLQLQVDGAFVVSILESGQLCLVALLVKHL